MWCKHCEHETNFEYCELCQQRTDPVIPTEIFYCYDCNTPIIVAVNDPHKATCPLCHGTAKYLASDMRPVFPEERLLVEILLDKPMAFHKSSVWANTNRYYIDGKTVAITSKFYKKYTPEYISKQLEKFKPQNTYKYFNSYIERFITANHLRLDTIIEEAHAFINKEASHYPIESIVISFSGGKDSTVTADLTVKALSEPSLVHIFGNTTLEFPTTIAYAERFRQNNPKAIFRIAINREQDFMKVCEDIGPPARMMRWY